MVKEEDIDIFNHVNNLKFMKYLEQARLEWYKSLNLNLKILMNNGLGIVLRNIEVSFIGEGLLGDTLTIETIPYKRGNSSFTFKQNIYNQNGDHITEAKTTSVMIDLDKRKSIPVIDEIARHFEKTKVI